MYTVVHNAASLFRPNQRHSRKCFHNSSQFQSLKYYSSYWTAIVKIKNEHIVLVQAYYTIGLYLTDNKSCKIVLSFFLRFSSMCAGIISLQCGCYDEKKDIFIMSLHQFSKKAQKIRKATAEAFSFFRRKCQGSCGHNQRAGPSGLARREEKHLQRYMNV